MNTSRQIGSIIRELRTKQNMTGEELGRRAELSQSKISKIENGYYASLKYQEVKRLLNILSAPSTIRQRVLGVFEDAASMSGRRTKFYSINWLPALDIERNARTIKIYTANALPALVQTIDYRTGSLKSKGVSDDDIDKAIKVTLVRQDLMWDRKRSYHFVVPEAALYTLATPKKDHLVQLDRLERLLRMPNVQFGIIPTQAGQVLIEYSSFALFDERVLVQAIAQHEITSSEKEAVTLHNDVFAGLQRLACFDEDAVGLIRRALTYFS